MKVKRDSHNLCTQCGIERIVASHECRSVLKRVLVRDVSGRTVYGARNGANLGVHMVGVGGLGAHLAAAGGDRSASLLRFRGDLCRLHLYANNT